MNNFKWQYLVGEYKMDFPFPTGIQSFENSFWIRNFNIQQMQHIELWSFSKLSKVLLGPCHYVMKTNLLQIFL
jgi:hypothetical protein